MQVHTCTDVTIHNTWQHKLSTKTNKSPSTRAPTHAFQIQCAAFQPQVPHVPALPCLSAHSTRASMARGRGRRCRAGKTARHYLALRPQGKSKRLAEESEEDGGLEQPPAKAPREDKSQKQDSSHLHICLLCFSTLSDIAYPCTVPHMDTPSPWHR